MKIVIPVVMGIALSCIGIAIGVEQTRETKKNHVYELAKKTVVRISILGSGTCSATVVSDKYAFTAAHCLPAPPAFFSYLLGAGQHPMYLVEKRIAIVPAAQENRMDAGVLFGNFVTLPQASLVDHTKAKVFEVEKAVLCGYPLYSSVLRCNVARRIGSSQFAAVFDTTALPGMSGGAVFSLDGELIGIIHSVNDEGQTRVSSTTGVLSLTSLKLP